MKISSSIVELICYLGNLGINLEVNGEKLHAKAPEGALNPSLRQEIAERKTEIIAFLQQANQVKAVEQLPIQAVARDGKQPLSFAQQRLWFLHQLLPASPAYNMLTALHLKGSLNIAAFEQSINEIVCRHEALRTTFTMENGQPVQCIAAPTPFKLSLVNWEHLSPTEQLAQTQQFAIIEAQKPFDLAQFPLFKIILIRFNNEEQVLLLKMHHIIYDGWSLSLFIRELSTLYAAFSTGVQHQLPKLPIQYADFAVWQRQWLTGKVLERQLNYWKQHLADAPISLELPTDKTRPPIPTFRGSSVPFRVDSNLIQRLKDLSQKSEGTLFMTLLAVFTILLSRYTDQSDIVIGSAIANRNRQEIEPLIGFFVNTLALRINLSSHPTFEELLAQVRQVTLNAYAHQDLPFEMLVEKLQPERNLGINPLVQVGFTLQNAPIEAWNLAGLSVNQINLPLNNVRFDLEVHCWEKSLGIEGTFVYSSDLFTRDTITRMVGHYQTLLSAIVAAPQQQVFNLPMLTQRERQQLLFEWNNTLRDDSNSQCIHQLFEAQVEQTPDAVAVVFADEQLTYHELNKKANKIAHHLLSLGVEPEVLIGLCVERSSEMLVGLLGILKAGGAYVPLDPAYPSERLAFMLEDAQIPVLLTQERLVDRLPKHHAKVVCLDTHSLAIAHESEQNPDSTVTTENLAYVIYTSGSTGLPKGVLVTHSGLCNLALAQIQLFDVGCSRRILQFASVSFDASIWEVVMAIGSGATLYLGTPSALLPGKPLIGLLQQYEITHITLPPSVLAVLPTEGLPALQTTILAGEACSAELVAKRAKTCRLFNAYGPTEATVCATVSACTENSRKPPIGRPITNTQVYILDRHLEPVPIGVPGELYIGNVGLARGYLNRPELTAAKFIPNPFENSKFKRLYKTGDLVRHLPDGNIEFIGRIDHQVKVRGFRIELGEIEAVLVTHPEVRLAVVIAKDDIRSDKRLVAYLVPQMQPPSASELRSFLKLKLPDYMVPATFVMLENLPLTPNGKVDHRALPEPDATLPNTENYVMPNTEAEKIIADVWQKVMQVKKVGIHDNFFDLGGHSLLLLQINQQFQEFFGSSLSIIDMFKYPTIHSLTKYLSSSLGNKTTSEPTNSRDQVSNDGKAWKDQQLQLRLKHRLHKK